MAHTNTQPSHQNGFQSYLTLKNVLLLLTLSVLCWLICIGGQSLDRHGVPKHFNATITPDYTIQNKDQEMITSNNIRFLSVTRNLGAHVANGDTAAITEYEQRKKELFETNQKITNQSFSSEAEPSSERGIKNLTTPTAVSGPDQNGRIEFPPNNQGWIKVYTLQPGETVEADPHGRVQCHPTMPPLPPEGQDYVSTAPHAAYLPDPQAPACSLLIKLGEDGQAMVIAGQLRQELPTITQPTNLYVRVNDYPMDPNGFAQAGVSDDTGSFPLIIKK